MGSLELNLLYRLHADYYHKYFDHPADQNTDSYLQNFSIAILCISCSVSAQWFISAEFLVSVFYDFLRFHISRASLVIPVFLTGSLTWFQFRRVSFRGRGWGAPVFPGTHHVTDQYPICSNFGSRELYVSPRSTYVSIFFLLFFGAI